MSGAQRKTIQLITFHIDKCGGLGDNSVRPAGLAAMLIR
jgi:hypothetical protein